MQAPTPKTLAAQTRANVATLLRIIRHPKTKAILLHLAGGPVNDTVDFALAEHLKACHPSLCVSDEDISQWEKSFVELYPIQTDIAKALAILPSLPWSEEPTFPYDSFGAMLIGRLRLWIASADWAQDGGKWIPHAWRWLDKQRFRELPRGKDGKKMKDPSPGPRPSVVRDVAAKLPKVDQKKDRERREQEWLAGPDRQRLLDMIFPGGRFKVPTTIPDELPTLLEKAHAFGDLTIAQWGAITDSIAAARVNHTKTKQG